MRRSTVENLPATTGDHSYVNVMSINDLNAISKHASKQQSEDVLYQSIHVELPPSSREAPGSSDCDRLNVQPYAVTDIHPEAAKEYLVVPTAVSVQNSTNTRIFNMYAGFPLGGGGEGARGFVPLLLPLDSNEEYQISKFSSKHSY